jgi:FixJ family two-component response regulator
MRVEAYATAGAFLAQYDAGQRGCLVLDIRMPGMDGLELQRVLGERGIEIPIVFLTGHGDVPMAVQAMEAGAAGFVEKPFREQQLLERVKGALRLDASRRKARAGRVEVSQRLATLTPRERQVLRGVLAGKINKVIATELGLSRKTVDQHRARVMCKLEADNIVALVKLVGNAESASGTIPRASGIT